MAKILYRSCLNEAAIELLDLKPLLTLAETIGTWPVLDHDWSDEGYNWEEQYANLRLLTGIEGIISTVVFEDPKNSSRRVLWVC